jgi:hypothetical protein
MDIINTITRVVLLDKPQAITDRRIRQPVITWGQGNRSYDVLTFCVFQPTVGTNTLVAATNLPGFSLAPESS